MKILFTGGGGVGNEAIYRLLNKKYDLYFADADINNINPSIPKERCFEIPFANDESYFLSIVRLLKNLEIDLLVPGVDEELQILANNSKCLLPTQLLLPDKEYIKIMLDKYTMNQVLKEKGILVPKTNHLIDCYEFKFPCIVKPRHGRGSRNVFIVNDEIKLEEILKDDLNDFIIQEKIEGIEYTVQMIANHKGELKAIVPVRADVKKGITLKAEIDYNNYVLNTCMDIHKAIPTKGVYNIQCILTKDSKVYPFEINPRISTTFCMVLAAGIDPIDLYFSDNAFFIYPNKIKLQRHYINYFSEEI